MRRYATPVVLWLMVLFLMCGCASGRRPAGDEDGYLARKFALSSYIEEGDLVALIVGARQAGIVKESDYMPLEIGVANKGLSQLTLTPESFVLVDEDGNRYPAIPSTELYREYRRVDVDRRLGEILPVLLGRFPLYSLVPSNFTPSFDFPAPLKRPVLQRHALMQDLIYFPSPATGVRGRTFELFLSSPELESPVFVRFRVASK